VSPFTREYVSSGGFHLVFEGAKKKAVMQHAAAITILLAAQLMAAPPPKLVREIDLNQILPIRPGHRAITTYAFSPDEKWLAVTLAVRPTDPSERRRQSRPSDSSRVFLVPVNGPAELRMQIDPGLSPLGMPGWSPNSDAFFVQGLAALTKYPYAGTILKLWNLRGAELLSRDGPGVPADVERMSKVLNIPADELLNGDPPRTLDTRMGGIFGFLDPEHLLARRLPAKATPAAFETLNRKGQVVDTWTVPKDWKVLDINPDRHLLAVSSYKDASTTHVVDYLSKKVVLNEDNPYDLQSNAGGLWEFFTEGGRTLCSVGSIGNVPDRKDTFTECWDVDSGKKIAQFGGFLGGAPAAGSSHSSRLVLTSGYFFPKKKGAIAFSDGDRVVWDFRSGTEVAAWNAPQTPAYSISISSTGRYVAEADGALLRIYELP